MRLHQHKLLRLNFGERFYYAEGDCIMRNKNLRKKVADWITIPEAVEIANNEAETRLTESDIYRHALCGNIFLSIYFQSPLIIQKLKMINNKFILRPLNDSFINRLCFLEKNCFLSDRILISTTEGSYIYPKQKIIDTTLAGYEYVLVQRLLAKSLKIPSPNSNENHINYGITVTISGNTFKLFESVTLDTRMKQQAVMLPISRTCIFR